MFFCYDTTLQALWNLWKTFSTELFCPRSWWSEVGLLNNLYLARKPRPWSSSAWPAMPFVLLNRELKHQTFLIDSWSAKCKSLSKTIWKHHERRQNNSVENAFHVLCYEENMISDEEFLLLYDEYSSKDPQFEPLVSTLELAFSSPWPQCSLRC